MMTSGTSGILAVDPSGMKNTEGKTEAELVAHTYRTSPESSPTASRTPGDQGDLKRSSSAFGGKSETHSNMDALTYIDEDFNYYSSKKDRGPSTKADHSDMSLVDNAADMGRLSRHSMADLGELLRPSQLYSREKTNSSKEYQDPYKPDTLLPDVPEKPKSKLEELFGGGIYPLEQRIENKRRGIGRQKYPFLGM